MYKNKIVKILSNFIPIKSLRKIFKEKFLTSIIENRGKNNKLIFVDEHGNEVKSKYIKNLHIKFCGDNNIICMYVNTVFKNKVQFNCAGNNLISIGMQKFPGYPLNLNMGIIEAGCSLIVDDYVVMEGVFFDFQNAPNTNIHICNESMLSSGIAIKTSDSHTIVDNKTGAIINPPEDIIVGEHTWIGMGATILKGANIPPNSIIGAKSVYTKSSNPKDLSNWDGGIFVGQPAKLKKTNVTWYRDEYEYKQAKTLVAVRERERESNPSSSPKDK